LRPIEPTISDRLYRRQSLLFEVPCPLLFAAGITLPRSIFALALFESKGKDLAKLIFEEVFKDLLFRYHLLFHFLLFFLCLPYWSGLTRMEPLPPRGGWAPKVSYVISKMYSWTPRKISYISPPY